MKNEIKLENKMAKMSVKTDGQNTRTFKTYKNRSYTPIQGNMQAGKQTL